MIRTWRRAPCVLLNVYNCQKSCRVQRGEGNVCGKAKHENDDDRNENVMTSRQDSGKARSKYTGEYICVSE